MALELENPLFLEYALIRSETKFKHIHKSQCHAQRLRGNFYSSNPLRHGIPFIFSSSRVEMQFLQRRGKIEVSVLLYFLLFGCCWVFFTFTVKPSHSVHLEPLLIIRKCINVVKSSIAQETYLQFSVKDFYIRKAISEIFGKSL